MYLCVLLCSLCLILLDIAFIQSGVNLCSLLSVHSFRTFSYPFPLLSTYHHRLHAQVSSEICPWWSGYVKDAINNTEAATLISLLDTCSVEGRDPAKPLRIPVSIG